MLSVFFRKNSAKSAALAATCLFAASLMTGCATTAQSSGTAANATINAETVKSSVQKLDDLPNGKYYAYGDTARPYFEVENGKVTLHGFTPALYEEILLGIYEVEPDAVAGNTEPSSIVEKTDGAGGRHYKIADTKEAKTKLRTSYNDFVKKSTFSYSVWDSPFTGKFISNGYRPEDGKTADYFKGIEDSGLSLSKGNYSIMSLVEADPEHGYTFIAKFGGENISWRGISIPFKLITDDEITKAGHTVTKHPAAAVVAVDDTANDTNTTHNAASVSKYYTNSKVYNPATGETDIDLLSADTKLLPHAVSDSPSAGIFPADLIMTPPQDFQIYINAGIADMK